jgi:hypothetical protein
MAEQHRPIGQNERAWRGRGWASADSDEGVRYTEGLCMQPCPVSRPSPAADMAKFANDFVEFGRESGDELDYSEASLETVEQIIDAEFADWRPWRRGKAKKANVPVASLVGAYVGEVMVRNLGGTWGWMPEYNVAAIQTQAGGWTSPPAKAQKRFINGKEDDLVFYYEAMKQEFREKKRPE